MLPNNGRSISRIVAKNVPCFTKPVIRNLIALVPESQKTENNSEIAKIKQCFKNVHLPLQWTKG